MMNKAETRLIKANGDAAETAAACLKAGGLVAFPTETVYGLGADAANGKAIARLYVAKGRPSFNPLIAHVPNLAAAQRLGAFDAAAEILAAAFWPGPLTLVVPKAPGCPVAALATAGLDTIAVRVPDSPVAQAILKAFGGAIVAPSANRSGHVSPTIAAHVAADLGGTVDLIVDGGATRVGLESTIVGCVGTPTLLRSGAVTREAIEQVLGQRLATPGTGPGAAPAAPGMLASHYAPKARLRRDAGDVRPGEALLAFGPQPPAGANRAVATLNLSAKGDLVEAAANLFAHLRALDRPGIAGIAVMPIPHEGLGVAINDRLARAAAPRDTT